MKICMKSLDKLASRDIWRHFSDICGIPHPSKKEGRLVQHIKRFGESLGLETIVDEIGNVLIRKAATAGMEGCKSVVFQSHVDMVCEKNGDVEFDFDNDAIEPYVDGGWVKARGTTLGADNGIGVAAQMALLASKDIEHGPIECLFTVDEETGLSGANAFGSGLLRSKILINLDSEEDGNFCIGCAGGIDTVAKFPLEMKNAPEDLFYFRVEVKGFKGGHSGEDINKGRGNAVQTLARYLCRLKREFSLAVSEIHGGNLRNAIAREAFAVVGVPYKQKERVRVMLNVFIDEIQREYPSETEFEMLLESEPAPELVMESTLSDNLLNALHACIHGVVGMSSEIEGLVETSTNLASVRMADGFVKVETSQRSSVESKKHDLKERVEALFALAGAEVSHGDGYPGWKPNVNSEIKSVVVDTYRSLFGREPIVRAIHAGLECGLIFEKYPDMDMISIGPTIIGNHSPAEMVDIESVDKFWLHLKAILKALKA